MNGLSLKNSNDRICNAYKNATEKQKKEVGEIMRRYWIGEEKALKRENVLCIWVTIIIVIGLISIVIWEFGN